MLHKDHYKHNTTMPAKPSTISLAELDPAIRTALGNIAASGKLRLPKGPIINGIILTEAALKGVSAAAVAKHIVASIPGAAEAGIKPATTVVGPGKILVGFKTKGV